MDVEWWMLVAFFFVAALYSGVGHGGASGYLALMALLAFAPATLRPTALVLNVAVSLVATVMFARGTPFRHKLFWPFAISAVPMAWVGGSIHLPVPAFKAILGVVLVLAAVRMVVRNPVHGGVAQEPRLTLALLIGSVVGLLSGLIGVGGGIFLTPILIFAKWADPREAASVSAPFILANSIAGLFGGWKTGLNLHPQTELIAAAVVAGGILGANWGATASTPEILRRVLAAVLVVAGAKLLLG